VEAGLEDNPADSDEDGGEDSESLFGGTFLSRYLLPAVYLIVPTMRRLYQQGRRGFQGFRHRSGIRVQQGFLSRYASAYISRHCTLTLYGCSGALMPMLDKGKASEEPAIIENNNNHGMLSPLLSRHEINQHYPPMPL